ncbi:MAG: arginine--tRNA ligase [Clostridia bacterium]|nr:arginine--tRNA ligase [Clostridia bacterium]
MNLKNDLVKRILYTDVEKDQLLALVSTPPDRAMGDFSLPCFSLAKTLRKSPMAIAEDIKRTVLYDGMIESVEVVGGYLNFRLNKNNICQYVIDEVLENGFEDKDKNQKVVCIDYSSVNLAKYMHIGHWATTIIGESIARLYESQGWRVVRMNYIGDYGLPFGKMVYAYLEWGNEEDIEARGVDAIQDLYVEFCKREDEQLLEKAREISKQIEDKERKVYGIYKWFIDIAKKEAERLLDRAGIEFDTWKGESAYNDCLDEVVEEIKQSGLGKVSEGAFIVDLSEYGMGVSVIQRSDGASLYVTRDLAALEDRYQTYDFDEMIYVTAVQQNNHFEKLFKLCELLDKPYKDKLYHASYGMFSLPEGKIASRKGKQALFEDILNLAEENVQKAFTNKNFNEEDKKEIGEKIAKSAVAFSVLKVDRIKDKLFEVDKATSFDGETAPYVQYTYARCNSILQKAEQLDIDEPVLFEGVDCEYVFPIAISISNLENAIENAFNKKEPSLLAREIIELCQNFNKFYNEVKVIDENNLLKTNALLALVEAVKQTLAYVMPLVCIDIVEEM